MPASQVSIAAISSGTPAAIQRPRVMVASLICTYERAEESDFPRGVPSEYPVLGDDVDVATDRRIGFHSDGCLDLAFSHSSRWSAVPRDPASG